jgi:HEPN domain-containing protein
MPHEGSRAGSAEEWLRYARADLSLARVPLPDQAMYEQLCFHAQQSAEKALKAVLVYLRVDFPNTHNLGVLLDMISERQSIDVFLITAATLLTVYAVAARYPGVDEPVRKEEYERAVRAAEDVVKWASNVLDVESLES